MTKTLLLSISITVLGTTLLAAYMRNSASPVNSPTETEAEAPSNDTAELFFNDGEALPEYVQEFMDWTAGQVEAIQSAGGMEIGAAGLREVSSDPMTEIHNHRVWSGSTTQTGSRRVRFTRNLILQGSIESISVVEDITSGLFDVLIFFDHDVAHAHSKTKQLSYDFAASNGHHLPHNGVVIVFDNKWVGHISYGDIASQVAENGSARFPVQLSFSDASTLATRLML